MIASALVTGATGFIGSALVRRLVQDGTRVVCLVRPESARAATLRGVEVVRELESVEPTECVFNLASYGVRPGDRDPALLIEGNVSVLAHVLRSVAPWGVQRFVHVGTCSEYAPVAAPALLQESAPLEPGSLYGAAKAAAHVFGTALARELGVPLLTLRLFGTYGPGEAAHRLIPHLVARLGRGEQAEMTSGEQVRDMTYIDDVVEALLCTAGLESYRAYNVCSGTPVRIREMAEAVARELGQPLELLGLGRIPMRDYETPWIVGDPARFQGASGWRPQVALADGIRRTVTSAR